MGIKDESMEKKAVRFKGTLQSLTFGSMFALLSLGLAACSHSPENSTQPATSEDSSMAMEGMDHGSDMMSMDLGPADEQFDLRFIDGMTPHHEGAIAMAQEALQKSDRPEIQQLAQAIIDAQDEEITALKEWRTAWYPDAGDQPVMYSAEMGHTMPMTEEMRSGMMMSGDLGAADDEFDLRFINAMIPHHEGAIDMAQQALEKSDRPETTELAQNIIDSQQQEIAQMMQWRQDWYGQ